MRGGLFPKSKRKEERREETTVTSEEQREKLESAEKDIIFAESALGLCFSRISLSLSCVGMCLCIDEFFFL